MRLKNVLFNSIWFGVIPKISSLLNVLLLPILTPFLTPSDYGIWGIVSSYITFFIAVYTLGLHIHLGNSYYEFKVHYSKVWGRLLFMLIISALFFSIVLFFIVFALFEDLGKFELILISIVTTFPVLFNANALIANHFYTFTSNPKPYVYRGLVSSLSGLIVLYICVRILKLGYLGFILGGSVSSLILFLSFIKPLWIEENLHPRIERNWKRIGHTLNKSLPVIPHAVGFVMVSSASRIIMNYFDLPFQIIGIFTNGYILGDYITIISTAIVTSIVPLMQTSYRSGNLVKYRHYFYFAQSIAFVVIFTFSLWLPEIYSLLVRNADLQSAMPIARKICFANGILPFYYFVSSVVFIKKDTKQLLWLVFLPGVLNVVLCFLLIPLYGVNAAVYSTILSYWSLLVVPFVSKYHAQNIEEWLGSRKKVVYTAIVLIVLFMVSYYTDILSFFAKIALTGAIILTSTILFYIFNKKNDLFIL